MTEFLQQLSDDQVALLGCVGALFGSMLLMSLSYHTNRRQQNVTTTEAPAQPTAQPVMSKEQPRRAA